MDDLGEALRAQVEEAAARRTPLAIVGGASKGFFGRQAEGALLRLDGHRGVIDYEPTELVITARSGTPLAEIEAVLAEQRQMLAFEPPHFGMTATLGGAIACGLSGPRRPYAGAARDFVLGARIVNGQGEILRFGGQVMKNVAGYDVSRLMVGALGTLGVLLEVSLKVLPQPVAEMTLSRQCAPEQALDWLARWAGQPLPLSASCFVDDRLYVRLSGTATGVEAAQRAIGGDRIEAGGSFWRSIAEHTHPFFTTDATDRILWRLAVPAATPLSPPGRWLLDWGGAQRWLYTEASSASIREAVEQVGGHAQQFRGGDRRAEVFHPLSAPLASVHRKLKAAFDPQGILNPGRLYRDW